MDHLDRGLIRIHSGIVYLVTCLDTRSYVDFSEFSSYRFPCDPLDVCRMFRWRGPLSCRSDIGKHTTGHEKSVCDTFSKCIFRCNPKARGRDRQTQIVPKCAAARLATPSQDVNQDLCHAHCRVCHTGRW